jgi:hypothetical protein
VSLRIQLSDSQMRSRGVISPEVSEFVAPSLNSYGIPKSDSPDFASMIQVLSSYFGGGTRCLSAIFG